MLQNVHFISSECISFYLSLEFTQLCLVERTSIIIMVYEKVLFQVCIGDERKQQKHLLLMLEGACHCIFSVQYHPALGPISIRVLFSLTISLSSVLLTYLRGQSQEGWWSVSASYEFMFVYSLILCLYSTKQAYP